MSRKNSYSLETEVVHYQTGDEYNASVPPLYQTATFKQQSLSNMGNTITQDQEIPQEPNYRTILQKS